MSKYEFRYNRTWKHPKQRALNVKSVNVSQPLIVNKSGSYTVQCRFAQQQPQTICIVMIRTGDGMPPYLELIYGKMQHHKPLNTSALPPAMQMTKVPPVPQPAPNATHSSQPKSNGIDRMKRNMKYVLAGLSVLSWSLAVVQHSFYPNNPKMCANRFRLPGCIEPPVARNPVAMLNDTQFKSSGTQVPNADGYRIFLITQGQAGTDPSGKYIIFNILDNTNDVGETDQYKPIVSADARFLPPTQTDYTWTLPTS